MRKIPILYSILLAISFLVSCEKDPDAPQPKTDPIDEIIGAYLGDVTQRDGVYRGYYDADNNFVATDSMVTETTIRDSLVVRKNDDSSFTLISPCMEPMTFDYSPDNEYLIRESDDDLIMSISLVFDIDNFSVRLETSNKTDPILSPSPQQQIESCTFSGFKQ